jgi:hypothetical protein
MEMSASVDVGEAMGSSKIRSNKFSRMNLSPGITARGVLSVSVEGAQGSSDVSTSRRLSLGLLPLSNTHSLSDSDCFSSRETGRPVSL